MTMITCSRLYLLATQVWASPIFFQDSLVMSSVWSRSLLLVLSSLLAAWMLIPRSLRPRFGTLLAKKGWYFFASFVFCDLGFFFQVIFFFFVIWVCCVFCLFFKLLSFSFCDFLDGFLLFHVCFWVNSLFCVPGLG